MRPEDLDGLEDLAAARDLDILPTVYLRRPDLTRLEEMAAAYRDGDSAGRFTRIKGFAVEGPLLGPEGGIPRESKWYPSADEWERIAALGGSGLRYVVMAPDALGLAETLAPGLTFEGLIRLMYANGTRLALGHFYRDNPARSAERVSDVLDLIHATYESSPYLVLTDHLYNDMPRSFTHAFRTEADRLRRDRELDKILGDTWTSDRLSRLLGPVPAAVLNAALSDRLMPCINFDGQHVDLAVTARTTQFLGVDRLIALTDHTEGRMMAGEVLTKDPRTGLLLRDDGAVAAGSFGPEAQTANMRHIGLSEDDIRKLFYSNPNATVAYRPQLRTA